MTSPLFLSAASAAAFSIWASGWVKNIESQAGRSRNPSSTEIRKSEGRLDRALVTGLGAGYLPVAPGTWGSAEAVLLALALHWLAPAWERIALGLLTLVLLAPAIRLSGRVARREGNSDPSLIVVDEILGQWLCLLWAPLSWLSLLSGFLLFRFTDIVKPFPARRSEKLPGGWGIVCDDLIAGIYAGLALAALHHLGLLGSAS